MERIYTPENINSLKPNEVFVFGSSLSGHHGGGAASAAVNKFGAIKGQGVGLQGQSYAIPTMQGGVETIKPYVDEFIKFAEINYDKTYYVTRIGCGIAGFKDEEIAPLFLDALSSHNIILPKSFVDVLTSPKYSQSYLPTWKEHYTSYDMTVDYFLILNRFKHYLIEDKEEALEELSKLIGNYKRRNFYTWAEALYNQYPGDYTGLSKESLSSYFENVLNSLGDLDPFDAPISRYLFNVFKEIATLMAEVADWNSYPRNTGWGIAGTYYYTLFSIMTGRWSCGDNSYLYDDFDSAYPIFIEALKVNWDSLFVNGMIDENKVIKVLSDPDIWSDWQEKAAHGKAIFYSILPVLNRECEDGGNYCRTYNYSYFPKKEFSLPVFDRERGRVHFPNFTLKKACIENLRCHIDTDQ